MGIGLLKERYGIPLEAGQVRADVLPLGLKRQFDKTCMLDFPMIGQPSDLSGTSKPFGNLIIDRSGYNSHGTIYGATWIRSSNGKWGLDFDPTIPSYVEIPAVNSTQLNFTSQNFSFIMRLYRDTATNYACLFRRGEEPVSGYSTLVNPDGTITLYTYQPGTGQGSATQSGGLATGTWQTLGFSRNGSSVKIYVNGIDKTWVQGTHIDPVSSPEPALVSIFWNKVLYPFDGKIEFLSVFGGIALSPADHLWWHNRLK